MTTFPAATHNNNNPINPSKPENFGQLAYLLTNEKGKIIPHRKIEANRIPLADKIGNTPVKAFTH